MAQTLTIRQHPGAPVPTAVTHKVHVSPVCNPLTESSSEVTGISLYLSSKKTYSKKPQMLKGSSRELQVQQRLQAGTSHKHTGSRVAQEKPQALLLHCKGPAPASTGQIRLGDAAPLHERGSLGRGLPGTALTGHTEGSPRWIAPTPATGQSSGAKKHFSLTCNPMYIS